MATLDEVARKLPLGDLPAHPSVELGRVSLGTASRPGQEDEEGGARPILRVRRPRLSKPPAPPELLAGWLMKGWEEPDGRVAVWQ